MGIAPHYERLKIAHHDFMKVEKNAAPLHERFSNVHHGFMRALELHVYPFSESLKNMHNDL